MMSRRIVLVVAVVVCLVGGVTGCWKNDTDTETEDAVRNMPNDGEGNSEDTPGGGSNGDTSEPDLSEVELSLTPAFNGRSFTQPVWAMQMTSAPDRWFVVEQPGRIQTFTTGDDRTDMSVWADISGRVTDGGERGLLGMAVHPEWPDQRVIYLSYTSNDPGPLTSRISAFDVSAPGDGSGASGDVGAFQAESEDILLTIEQPYGNHNGGQITFGPDGYLYAGYGDGGAGGDPEDNGQNPSTLLGSMLRVDPTSGDPYAIPESNPFAGDGSYETDEGNTVEGAAEVYAWGLRNPWRWSFDSKSGDLWAGDVGQNAWEEIDIVELGENYGWNMKEATHCYAEDPCDGPFEAPVVEYSHDLGQSVTGGYVYRGDEHAALEGVYVFADYVSGRIWGIPDAEGGRPYDKTLITDTDHAISSFAQGLENELYVISYGGTIYSIGVQD